VSHLFAGTEGGGVWRRPLSEMIRTEVDEMYTSIPGGFFMEQNYPNPFNTDTRIKFFIPHSENVTLKVFDMMGKEVASLVTSTLPPGTNEFTFNGSDFPSGMYFYRLQAGGFVLTKKLVLQK
jgi:hypothetical protein